jgi:hypothetical protein
MKCLESKARRLTYVGQPSRLAPEARQLKKEGGTPYLKIRLEYLNSRQARSAWRVRRDALPT